MGIAVNQNHIFGLNECQRVYDDPKSIIKRHSNGKSTNAFQIKILKTDCIQLRNWEKLVKYILYLTALFL